MSTPDALGEVIQSSPAVHLPPNAGPSIELITALDQALAKARGDYGSLTKDATNPAFRSRYLTLDKLLDAVTPALSKVGVNISSSYESTPAGLVVVTCVSHSKGGWRISTFPVLDMSKSQAIGSSATYAQRYNIGQLLAVAADNDDDGNSADGVKTSSAAANGSRPRTPSQPAALAGGGLM